MAALHSTDSLPDSQVVSRLQTEPGCENAVGVIPSARMSLLMRRLQRVANGIRRLQREAAAGYAREAAREAAGFAGARRVFDLSPEVLAAEQACLEKYRVGDLAELLDVALSMLEAARPLMHKTEEEPGPLEKVFGLAVEAVRDARLLVSEVLKLEMHCGERSSRTPQSPI